MNKVIFVGFDSEPKAYEGDRALHQMHTDGSITLYNDAVVVKDSGGKVAIRALGDVEPVGTLGGMVTGGLIGLLGGPVGAAVGLGTGTLMGAALDLTRHGVSADFVEEVGGRLEPGKAAVIAEVDEQWEVPLDTRMEALGGKLLRRTWTQVEDVFLEREIETAQKDLAALEAEQRATLTAVHTEKAKKQADKLQAKIDAAKRQVREKEEKLAAKMRALKQEGNDKIAVLEAQKATASGESKAQLEQRLAEVRRDYERQAKRLEEARERLKVSQTVSAA
jgi:uncharacterized membrane protein